VCTFALQGSRGEGEIFVFIILIMFFVFYITFIPKINVSSFIMPTLYAFLINSFLSLKNVEILQIKRKAE